MAFIDEVKIYVRAGAGGPGASHFRREKFVPLGGPDGGNGGKGGSIIVTADPGLRTLVKFQFKKEWIAKKGGAGEKNNKDGKAGNDIFLRVPLGTQIIDPKNGILITELLAEGQKHVLAKGGRGGKGNSFFKSATNRAPEILNRGEAGQEGEYILSLKLIADVGLVGLPNAGKSTLNFKGLFCPSKSC